MSTKRNRRQKESRFKRSGRRPGVYYRVYVKGGLAEAKYFTVNTIEHREAKLETQWWNKQEITTYHTYARHNVPEWMMDGMMLLDLAFDSGIGEGVIPEFGEVVRTSYSATSKPEYRYDFYTSLDFRPG